MATGHLPQQIASQLETWPEAAPISAKGLLHLGSRAAVDQALSRMTRGGQLLRIGRGLYVRPVTTRFGVRSPEVSTVLEAVQKETGEVIAPSGAATANQFGLTTQVPLRPVYLTSGRTRCLKLGSQTVKLKHAPPWQLTFAKKPAGAVVRVLAWGGKERGRALVAELRNKLSPETIEELSHVRGRVPTWMAQELSTLVPMRG
jgi:hypothetical protein